MMKTLVVVAGAILLAGCSQSPQQPPSPTPAQTSRTPEVFRVNLETSKGLVVIEVTRAWAPLGADRFYSLVKTGYYDGNRFFRVRPDFVVQWGINGDPSVSRLWTSMMMQDDPVEESNRKGTISFAKRGPNTRTTQVFINLKDNQPLDEQGFAPFGRVTTGMEVVESLYSAYGEMAPRGSGPDSGQIQLQGNAYLEAKFPRLDYIRKATVK